MPVEPNYNSRYFQTKDLKDVSHFRNHRISPLNQELPRRQGRQCDSLRFPCFLQEGDVGCWLLCLPAGSVGCDIKSCESFGWSCTGSHVGTIKRQSEYFILNSDWEGIHWPGGLPHSWSLRFVQLGREERRQVDVAGGGGVVGRRGSKGISDLGSGPRLQ